MNKQIVWIAGGSGLVGQRLVKEMDADKFDVFVLSRKKSLKNDSTKAIQWDTRSKTIDSDILPDHIINLAGAGIADSRWTKERKELLVSSRVDSAETLRVYLKNKNHKVKSYLGASAVGFYGNRKNEILSEGSLPGNEFMSECCVLWEKASHEMSGVAERVCIYRIGIVLSKWGGALPKMLMTKPLYVFNYFGNGQQYYPWIHIQDLVRFIIYTMEHSDLKGIYNTVAPQQITNKNMMKEITNTNKWNGLLLSAPSFILKMVLGEMSAVVLNSNRIDSQKITESGYKFQFTQVGEAVKDIMNKNL